MNKGIKLLFIIIIITIMILLIFTISQQNTIKDAIEESSQFDIEILYSDKNTDENFIIYQHKGLDDLSFVILKENFGKYKIYNSGTIGEIKESKQKLSISYCYVPRIKNLSSSYYYGIVNNADINYIKIFDYNDNYIEAEIINTAIGPIFFANIDKLDLYNKFNIRCYLLDNSEIEFIDDVLK